MTERTLNGLKRAGTLEKWRTEKGSLKVHIFSGQWAAWWRPGGAGYTTDIKQAGVYSMAEAIERTAHCGAEKRIIYQFAGGVA